MKLLKVIIILTSIFTSGITAQAKNTPGETERSLMPLPNYLSDPQMNFPNALWRWTQYIGFKLKKDEKQKHQSAVFYALENVPNGVIVSWYSDQRLANGKVRIVHSYQISGGYCRTYQAYIKIKNKSKHMTNNACKYIGVSTWLFYK